MSYYDEMQKKRSYAFGNRVGIAALKVACAEVDRLRAECGERDKEQVRLEQQLSAANASLAEAKDGEQYSDAKLTEHAEAVGVNPDHIDFIDETTKAIIAMWAENSRLKAANAEQFRLYCEETKKHNATAASLAERDAELRAVKESREVIRGQFLNAEHELARRGRVMDTDSALHDSAIAALQTANAVLAEDKARLDHYIRLTETLDATQPIWNVGQQEWTTEDGQCFFATFQEAIDAHRDAARSQPKEQG